MCVNGYQHFSKCDHVTLTITECAASRGRRRESSAKKLLSLFRSATSKKTNCDQAVPYHFQSDIYCQDCSVQKSRHHIRAQSAGQHLDVPHTSSRGEAACARAPATEYAVSSSSRGPTSLDGSVQCRLKESTNNWKELTLADDGGAEREREVVAESSATTTTTLHQYRVRVSNLPPAVGSPLLRHKPGQVRNEARITAQAATDARRQQRLNETQGKHHHYHHHSVVSSGPGPRAKSSSRRVLKKMMKNKNKKKAEVVLADDRSDVSFVCLTSLSISADRSQY